MNQLFCELVAFDLELKGAKVFMAENVDDAFNLYKTKKPDLVASDIRMPGRTGLELLDMIKSTDHKIPMIMMTGYSDVDSLDAFQKGSEEIFTKPVDRQRLSDAIAILTKDPLLRYDRPMSEDEMVEQIIEIEVSDLFNLSSDVHLQWGRVGYFHETEAFFPSIDAFIQLNIKSDDSGELTKIVGKIRFTRFEDVSVQIYKISGHKADELKNHLVNLNDVVAIPKKANA